MYKSKEIESTFIDLFNNNNSNMVISCIYKHPKVSVPEFTEDYLVPSLRKVSQREKRNNSNGGFQH